MTTVDRFHYRYFISDLLVDNRKSKQPKTESMKNPVCNEVCRGTEYLQELCSVVLLIVVMLIQ